MKTNTASLLAGLAALASALACTITLAASGSLSNSGEIRESGDIHGSVSLCTPEASSGLIVYIPGQSFSVITGSGGEFTLRYIPQGTYSVVIMRAGQVLKSVGGVAVLSKTVTDLGVINLALDQDNDGYNACVDCNDKNPAINPGAAEVCDGVDNNCNGQVDEGCVTCTDGDHDGYFAQGLQCGTAADCDDTRADVYPGAPELCFDGIDNNCNGQVDENCATCTPGAACGSPVGVCTYQYDSACNCVAAVSPTPETCNGLDDNCNGTVDEGTNQSVPNGELVCSGGNYYLNCSPGYKDCDGNQFNGCETPTTLTCP